MEGDENPEDVFQISSKEANPEALLKWRRATLALNATRRFRYTAKVKGGGEVSLPSAGHEIARTASIKMTPSQRFRSSGHALVAMERFKQAGRERQSRLQDESADGFGVTMDQLVCLSAENSLAELKALGGVLGVCRALRVDPERGIKATTEDVERRRQGFGANTYPEPPAKSIWMFAWEAAQDTTLVILMICAVVSLVAGMVSDGPAKGWYDGVSILVAIVTVIVVTAVSDYQQSLQFRGLNAIKADLPISVKRDGRMQQISIFALLVGDIVPLNVGDQIPGDGLVLSSHSLVVDEASMTGESEPVHKTQEAPFLLSGCKVVDGVGTMVVTAVGTNTEWGKVMATVNEGEEAETPLQVRLNGLATGIGYLGLTVGFLVLVVLIIRYAVEYTNRSVMTVVKEVTDILVIAITIVVVAVPEGLPLAVTLTLAYSMQKMMKDMALVRHLASCETMGSATTICSDKTGTLTLNQMKAVQEWLGGGLHDCGSGPAPGGALWECLSENVVQNGRGDVYVNPEGVPEVTASPTEAAIIQWALELGLDFRAVKEAAEVVALETFSSSKKRGGAVLRHPNGDLRVHWKGAPEILTQLCTSWMAHNGSIHPLDEKMREQVKEAIRSMAAASLRCVALACRSLSREEVPADTDAWILPDIDLVLLAIVGIKDPCRPEVPQAVSRCQGAGIKVRMVTGDNILTAQAIAGECGILTPDGVVIEGKDFRNLSKEEMLEIIPRIDVMARCAPTDKHLLVKTLRQMGDVVAVTGDGTNDAPALREADIGLSMGSGTPVAKESSDIVIMDDNFTSIVKVVRWGRAVYANIQKFIQFQLTVNVAALTIDFVVACTNGTEVPLTAVQLLWVNLIMDTLAALALATEPPTDELLGHKPVGRTAPLITNVMWRNIIFMAIYQVALLLTLFYAGRSLFGLEDSSNSKTTVNTIIFNTFVFCQLFNEINSRKPDKLNVFKGIFDNLLFIVVWAISLAVQVILVEVSVFHHFASTSSLSWSQWLFCVIAGFLSLPLGLLFKFIPVPATPFSKLIFPRRWRRRSTVSRSREGSLGRDAAVVAAADGVDEAQGEGAEGPDGSDPRSSGDPSGHLVGRSGRSQNGLLTKDPDRG